MCRVRSPDLIRVKAAPNTVAMEGFDLRCSRYKIDRKVDYYDDGMQKKVEEKRLFNKGLDR